MHMHAIFGWWLEKDKIDRKQDARETKLGPSGGPELFLSDPGESQADRQRINHGARCHHRCSSTTQQVVCPAKSRPSTTALELELDRLPAAAPTTNPGIGDRQGGDNHHV